jgi:ectoine hydroxylase-related dioxygenase (phytanoyl-CoA dioxygenase family)
METLNQKSLRPSSNDRNDLYKLSDEQLSKYNEDGYLIVRQLFSQQEVDYITNQISIAQEKAFELAKSECASVKNNDPCFVYRNGSQFVLRNDENIASIQRVVGVGSFLPDLLSQGRNHKITHPVSQIIQSDKANHIINQIHFKLPHDKVKFLWHQDIQNREKYCEAWKNTNGNNSYVVAITAIDEHKLDNGPLWVIPGSHKDGKLDFPRLAETKDLPLGVNYSSAIPVLLKPGDTTFFHQSLLHASWENESQDSRKTFINGFSYPGANICPYPGDGSGEEIQLDYHNDNELVCLNYEDSN